MELTTIADDIAELQLLRHTGVPLHRQLYSQLRERILAGALCPGTQLPASRVLCARLKVSRNTVIAALEQLAAEGLVSTRVGAGTVVTGDLALARTGHSSVKAANERGAAQSELRASARGTRLSHGHRALPGLGLSLDFQPGIPDVTRFPAVIWSRFVGRAYRDLRGDLSGYAHAGGFMPLRSALASYLSAARGLRCSAAQVLVVTTAQSALDLAARMLTDAGDTAWLEQPGYSGARAAFGANGLQVHGIEVDEQGLRVADMLARCADARIGYITPSHHFPKGYTLSMERRMQLLAWSQQAQGWILEDDYDSEFRYANRPVAALQGLRDDTRVVYVGSFSKTLFPGLRVAYIVVPEPLTNAFSQALRQTGQEPSLPLQLALFEFMQAGHFGRHIRRMRTIYGARHSAMTEALNHHLRALGQVLSADGGLQLTFGLKPQFDDRHLSEVARAQGFGVEPLSRYGRSEAGPGGLVFGFGQCPDSGLEARIAELAKILQTS
jgi:GntR family transcriptional regulator / MocR family aminotransferase